MELAEITVRVPAERLGRAYELIGSLFEATDDTPGREDPATVGAPRAWTMGDVERAREFLARTSPRVRKMLRQMADNPGKAFQFRELARVVGFERKAQIVSMTGGPGIRLKAMGKDLPWAGLSDGYGMTPEVAKVFGAAFNALDVS